MRRSMLAPALVVVGSLALAGSAGAADSRSGERRAPTSPGSSVRAAAPAPRAVATPRATAPRAAAPAPRVSRPAARPAAVSPTARSSAPLRPGSVAAAPARLAADQGSRTAPAGSQPTGGSAVPRGGDSGGGSVSPPISSSGGGDTIQSTSGSGHERHAPAGSTGRTATRSTNRPRDGRSVTGVATERTHPPFGGGGWGGGGWDNGYWWSSPAYYWGYAGFGLGYYYYDPFWWGPGYGYPYGGGGGYYSSSLRYDNAIGQLRLKVKPRDAQVYVDGAYAGVVDDFDGTFQRLDLPEGPHRVELRMPGHATLAFDVNILADELVTYRGRLEPQP